VLEVLEQERIPCIIVTGAVAEERDFRQFYRRHPVVRGVIFKSELTPRELIDTVTDVLNREEDGASILTTP
jgi:hypothetical protein